MDAESSLSNAPEQEIAEPALRRARWRRIVRRVLKYSLIASLICAMGLTAFAWIQCSKKNYYLTLTFSSRNYVTIYSYGRRIYLGAFEKNFSSPMSAPWVNIGSSPVESRPAFTETLTPRPTKMGLGIFTKTEYFDGPSEPTPNNPPVPLFSFDGLGIVMPFWFALLSLGSILMFVLMGRRFSLREFLIWVTVVCVILGIAVRASDDSSQNQDRSVRNGA